MRQHRPTQAEPNHDNGQCPQCERYNAMLPRFDDEAGRLVYECRDCGHRAQ